MKKMLCLALSLFALHSLPVFGSPIVVGYDGQREIVAETTNFTKFDLDFAGGSPRQLITAIEKATGQSLNILILDSDTNVQLPAFKLKQVCMPELFQVLRATSQKTEYVPMLNNSGFVSNQSFIDSYEFYTMDRDAGPNSVWYFHVDRPGAVTKPQQKVCRIYQLGPYLNNGLTVNDITTAIQTAWKMETNDSAPQMNYHEETKLLIAVGDAEKLAIIEDVLKALPVKRTTAFDPNTGLPVAVPDSQNVK